MRRPRTRQKPSLLKQIFGLPFWIFGGVAVVAGVLTLELKGSAEVEEALRSDLDVFLFIMPRILGGMLLAGLVQVVLPPEVVSKWVGEKSGIRGLVIATVVGALTPGGPMTSFPIVVAFYMSGADRGALVAYITAWSLLGFQRFLVWELPLLGPEVAVLRLFAVFWMPVLAGLIARRIPFGPAPAPGPETGRRGTGKDAGERPVEEGRS